MSDIIPPERPFETERTNPWAAPHGEKAMSDVLSRDSFRELEAVLGRRMDALTNENVAVKKQLRWALIGLGVVFFVTLVLAFLAAPRAAGVAETVQSNQFVLRDQTGLVRGLWEIEQGSGPRLVLRDGDGRERIRLSLLSDGSPGVTLGDREGRPRVVLGLLPDGTTNLVFADAAGTTRAVLGHSSTEATTLVLADRAGFTRAGLVVDADGEGALTLYERDDQPTAAPSTEAPAPSPADSTP
jgi:hypothetical protein